MPRFLAWTLGVLLLAAMPALARADDRPALRGLGVDETLDAGPALAPALDRAHGAASGLPVFVRLILRVPELDRSGEAERLDARLDLYAARRIPVLVTLADPPLAPSDIDAWRPALRALIGRCHGKVAGFQVGDRFHPAAMPSPQAYAYLLKFVAVQARSIDAALLVLEPTLPADAVAWQEALYREEVAAYSDGFGLALPTGDADRDRAETALRDFQSLVAERDPSAVIGPTGLPLGARTGALPSSLVAWQVFHAGGHATFSTWTGTTEQLAAMLTAAAAVKDMIGGELVLLDDAASSLTLSLDGRDVTSVVPHHLLYNTTTFATYLACWPDERSTGRLEVALHLPNAGTIAVRDPDTGRVITVKDAQRDESAKRTRVRIDVAPGRVTLIDFDYGAEEVYALRAEASERALPSVEEIVSRHQQAEAGQQARYHNYMARALVNLHFRPTATDSGYDLILENRFFWDPEVSEWEEEGFILNGTRWGRNRPPFPMLQPEKVLSLPLSLRFNRDYAYHLEGVETLDGRRCYVVRFDPVDRAQSLYRGKVWIDAERYVRLKVQAVQTKLTPPVVSNEETQTFQAVPAPGGGTVTLFSRLESRQIMLLAGRNILVEKQVTFSGFDLDNPGFQNARTAARAGDNVMYRDTDQGLRYLVKKGRERVVSDRLTTTAKALMMGATIDPSYDYPVPMGGLEYIDFNFLHKDLQFALIFAGVLAMGNVQKARIGGSRFDVNVDFFGIALASDDQVYDDVGERKAERLRSRSASAGANLGFQATDFQKISWDVHVQHDTYLSAPDSTSSGFTLPASGFTVSTGAGYEYRRGGYSISAAGTYARRATWRRWGLADQAFDPATRSYTKYRVSANKDVFFNAFNKLHLNAAFYGGQRQDRFSMYRFGLFDETRMRGVPSAGVRFSEMAMQRAQYSFNLFDLYRLDLFYDHAWGRTDERAGWSGTTGLGTEVSLRGPMGTLLKAGIGKGYLPRVYRGSGSWVVEFSILKPL